MLAEAETFEKVEMVVKIDARGGCKRTGVGCGWTRKWALTELEGVGRSFKEAGEADRAREKVGELEAEMEESALEVEVWSVKD
ncbi:MAG: hypothetical protein WA771_02385 [Chthoniobacterales bacterium]